MIIFFFDFVLVGIIGNHEARPLQEVTARHFDGSSQPENVKEDVKAAGIFGSNLNRPSTTGLPTSTVPVLISTETSMIQSTCVYYFLPAT